MSYNIHVENESDEIHRLYFKLENTEKNQMLNSQEEYEALLLNTSLMQTTSLRF